jgi:hypothetical protein
MAASTRVGNYLIRETIGTGASCRVQLAERVDTGECFALKIMQEAEGAAGGSAGIRREAAIMRVLDHPHVVALVDAFEEGNAFYLVTEYGAHGDLYDFLRARKALPPALAMHLFRQLIYGVEHLHQRGICHCDLKLENLFLDAGDALKIGDFGLARFARDGRIGAACGSLHYLAPEALAGGAYDGRRADLWSCGVVLFALLAGRLPFVDACECALAARIRAGRVHLPGCPADVRDLVARLLAVNPNARLAPAQVRAHAAFRLGLPREYAPPEPPPAPDLAGVARELADLGYAECAADAGGAPAPPRKGAREPDPRPVADVAHGCEVVLRALQRFAGGAGFDWAHPDDTRLLCSRRADGLEFVVGVRGSPGKAAVTARLAAGKESAFDAVIGGIAHALQRLPPDSEMRA